MKKRIALLLVLIVALTFTGCKSTNISESTSSETVVTMDDSTTGEKIESENQSTSGAQINEHEQDGGGFEEADFEDE